MVLDERRLALAHYRRMAHLLIGPSFATLGLRDERRTAPVNGSGEVLDDQKSFKTKEDTKCD